MSETAFRYKAFISYSHADSMWAEWLIKALEGYRVPKNLIGRKTDMGPVPPRLAPIFRDRDELPAAHRLTDRLFEALRGSEFLIILCSPSAAKSKLVNREIIEFKKTHGEGKLLCMIVEGQPFADDPEEECFPEALLHSFQRDGRKAGLSAEGLAADIRQEGDGKRLGLQKIIAGMIGVGLNDIVRRDDHRRHQRIIAGGIAAAIGMATLGGLVYQAQNAKQEALEAKAIAEQHSRNLEIARQDGEELVSFLASTVYQELEAVGRIKVLEDAATKILNYYENQSSSSVTEDIIQVRTVALFRLGQTLDRTGNSEAAKKIFDSALAQIRQAYEMAPDNPTITHRLQIALFFSGYLDHRMGRFDDARRKYEERLEVAKRGVEIDPERTAWRNNLRPFHSWEEQVAEAETFLGDLLAGPLGKVEEGLGLMEAAAAKRRVLLEELEWNANRATRLAASYQYLGRAYQRLGRFEDAKRLFTEQKRLYDRIGSEDPNNYNIIRRQYIIMRNLASVARDMGDLGTATTLFRDGAAGQGELAERDRNNILWRANAARAYYQLAEALYMEQDRDGATEALAKCRAHNDLTIAKDSTRPDRRLVRYQASLLEARIASAQGFNEQATKLVTALMKGLSGEEDSFTLTNGATENLAQTLLFRANLEEKRGATDLALATRNEALAALLRHPVSVYSRTLLADTYELLGDSATAKAITDRLDELKFDHRSYLVATRR